VPRELRPKQKEALQALSRAVLNFIQQRRYLAAMQRSIASNDKDLSARTAAIL
jgi:hypothetical protein